MVSVVSVLLGLLGLATAPCLVTATAASSELFPALRKRKQQQLAAAQKLARVSHADDSEAVGPVQPAEKEGSEAPEGVPAPIDVGADGYPQLPAVSKMLSGASGTLKTVNSQASVLEAHMVQAQMQIEANMAKQKAAFEEKLKQQEEANRQVIDENRKITFEINGLQGVNAGLRKHAHEIEQANQLMRSELHAFQSRLAGAKEFSVKSQFATDDSKNSLLAVLHSHSHKSKTSLAQTASKTTSKQETTDDADDDEDDSTDDSDGSKENSADSQDDEADDGEDSFLSLSMTTHRTSSASASTNGAASFEMAMSELESAVPGSFASMEAARASSPDDLLAGLSQEVGQLAHQEKDSEASLKQLFVRDFRAGAKRKAALVGQQKTLIASRDSLLTLQAKLKKAEAHLEQTGDHLQARLHTLGQYMQKMAHVAMAPLKEVPHLLEVLPRDVALKEKLV